MEDFSRLLFHLVKFLRHIISISCSFFTNPMKFTLFFANSQSLNKSSKPETHLQWRLSKPSCLHLLRLNQHSNTTCWRYKVSLFIGTKRMKKIDTQSSIISLDKLRSYITKSDTRFI